MMFAEPNSDTDQVHKMYTSKRPLLLHRFLARREYTLDCRQRLLFCLCCNLGKWIDLRHLDRYQVDNSCKQWSQSLKFCLRDKHCMRCYQYRQHTGLQGKMCKSPVETTLDIDPPYKECIAKIRELRTYRLDIHRSRCCPSLRNKSLMGKWYKTHAPFRFDISLLHTRCSLCSQG